MEIDRLKICPLLLRCFWRMHRNNALSEYRNTHNDIFPAQEIQIYTWQDATLREISEILKDVIAPARDKNSYLQFSLVFTDRSGQQVMRPVYFPSPKLIL
jgi:histone deacetylase complex subunit SAP18